MVHDPNGVEHVVAINANLPHGKGYGTLFVALALAMRYEGKSQMGRFMAVSTSNNMGALAKVFARYPEFKANFSYKEKNVPSILKGDIPVVDPKVAALWKRLNAENGSGADRRISAVEDKVTRFRNDFTEPSSHGMSAKRFLEKGLLVLKKS